MQFLRKPKPMGIRCAGEWTACLPEDVLQRTIDHHLRCDVATLRNLAVTCSSLAIICRRFIFRSVVLLPPGQRTVTSSTPSAERFVSTLQRYPETINFVEELHLVVAFPRPAKLFRPRTTEERAFYFILGETFPNLRKVFLADNTSEWDALSQGTQQRIIRFLGAHPLESVGIFLKSFSDSLLRQIKGNPGLHIAALFKKTVGRSPILDQHQHDGDTPRFQSIEFYHAFYSVVFAEQLGPNGTSIPVFLTALKALILGDIIVFSPAIRSLVHASKASLVSLHFTAHCFHQDLDEVPLDLGELPKLRKLSIGCLSKFEH
ncbi:hypothetical protein FA15DRAFT_758941, partial [Coprinopsis marcescibilis]